jgi:hypothetical protein
MSSINIFDNLTITKLGYYVYALVNPITNSVFYIGKGIENRVFAHKLEVLENKSEIGSLKKIQISDILENNLDLKHVIIRHGLTEKEAFLLEATLIDYHNFSQNKLTNEVSGHNSGFYGIKTTDELIRQYNAPKLEQLLHDVVIININKQYARVKNSENGIYEATKESWVINKNRIDQLKFALSEYQGIIIGVFKINKWYPMNTDNNKINKRWGFNGEEASDELKHIYLNKSIAHVKKKGAANPIRYKL